MHVHFDPPLTPASLLLPRRRLLICLGVLLGILAIAAAVANGQLLLTWDEPIQYRVEAARTPSLDELFLTVSRLGSTYFVLTLGAAATALTWRRCRAVSLALAFATLSRPLLEFTLKATVDRARPDLDRLVPGNGPSFPSGHVLAAVALWGLLPVVVALYTRRRALWWTSVAVSVTLIVGIAASRVYLGVHWFTDVTAGLVVGAFFLIGVDWVYHRAHARYPCRLAHRHHRHHGRPGRGQPQPELPPEPVPSEAVASDLVPSGVLPLVLDAPSEASAERNRSATALAASSSG